MRAPPGCAWSTSRIGPRRSMSSSGRSEVRDQRHYASPGFLRTLRKPVWDGRFPISYVSQGLLANEACRLTVDFSCCGVRGGRLGGDMSTDEARGTGKQAKTQPTQYYQRRNDRVCLAHRPAADATERRSAAGGRPCRSSPKRHRRVVDPGRRLAGAGGRPRTPRPRDREGDLERLAYSRVSAARPQSNRSCNPYAETSPPGGP